MVGGGKEPVRDTVACFGIPFGSLESSGWPYLVGQYQTLVVILLGPVFVPLACQIGNHHTLDQSPLDPLVVQCDTAIGGVPILAPSRCALAVRLAQLHRGTASWPRASARGKKGCQAPRDPGSGIDGGEGRGGFHWRWAYTNTTRRAVHLYVHRIRYVSPRPLRSCEDLTPLCTECCARLVTALERPCRAPERQSPRGRHS